MQQEKKENTCPRANEFHDNIFKQKFQHLDIIKSNNELEKAGIQSGPVCVEIQQEMLYLQGDFVNA